MELQADGSVTDRPTDYKHDYTLLGRARIETQQRKRFSGKDGEGKNPSEGN